MLFFSFLWNFTNRFVAKKSIAPPSANTGLTYNGSTQTGVNTGTGYSLSNNTGIDAKSYTAIATLSDTTNTQWSDGTIANRNISWSIATKSISVTWSTTTSFTYNGSEQAPTVTSPVTVVGNEQVYITRTTAKNVGSHTSTASISSVSGGRADKNNYSLTNATQAFTINKIKITPTVSMSGYTYAGTKKEPSISGNTGNGTVTYYYNTSNSNTGGTLWSKVTSSTSLDAKTYYMYAVVGATDNYEGATTSPVAFTISKATGYIKLTTTSGEIQQGTASTSFTISSHHGGALSATTTAGTATVNSSTKTVTVSNLSSVAGGTTVTITVTSAATTNYTLATTTYKLTINLKPNEGSVANSNISFKTDYGTIDVIWLDKKTNTPTTKPNAPILQSGSEKLIAVKFNENTTLTGDAKWVQANESNAGNDWYNYTDNGKGTERETQETDSENVGKLKKNNSSRWANARTKNNSYFVWIPRYAYRITYYESETSTVPTGYYDGYGMWRADGEIKYDLDKGIETVKYNGKTYIVHPAFMKDTGVTDAKGNQLADYERGGWSDDLEGFWFAKFEMGGSTAGALNSQFGTTSIREQNIGLQYENARKATYGYDGTYAEDIKANSFMNSHMVKNSEWGAVAYLTHSQYGLNGREIAINNNNDGTYYRGGGKGDAYIEKTNQSTTGNVYGIYDMSGNAWEHVASYNRLGNSTYLTDTSYGGNLTKYAKNGGTYISTKYITAYDNGTSEAYGTKIYDVGKIGDGTKETYLGTGQYGWFSDFADFVNLDKPFFNRGGIYNVDFSRAGVFYSDVSMGFRVLSISFRVSLCL